MESRLLEHPARFFALAVGFSLLLSIPAQGGLKWLLTKDRKRPPTEEELRSKARKEKARQLAPNLYQKTTPETKAIIAAAFADLPTPSQANEPWLAKEWAQYERDVRSAVATSVGDHFTNLGRSNEDLVRTTLARTGDWAKRSLRSARRSMPRTPSGTSQHSLCRCSRMISTMPSPSVIERFCGVGGRRRTRKQAQERRLDSLLASAFCHPRSTSRGTADAHGAGAGPLGRGR